MIAKLGDLAKVLVMCGLAKVLVMCGLATVLVMCGLATVLVSGRTDERGKVMRRPVCSCLSCEQTTQRP